MTKSEHRKQFSERFLEHSGVAVDASLPPFPDVEHERIKSREEIARRAERCVPLFRALGVMDMTLDYPSGITDTDAIAKTICNAKDLSEIVKTADDLDIDDILGTADTCMRMRHACVRSCERDDWDELDS